MSSRKRSTARSHRLKNNGFTLFTHIYLCIKYIIKEIIINKHIYMWYSCHINCANNKTRTHKKKPPRSFPWTSLPTPQQKTLENRGAKPNCLSVFHVLMVPFSPRSHNACFLVKASTATTGSNNKISTFQVHSIRNQTSSPFLGGHDETTISQGHLTSFNHVFGFDYHSQLRWARISFLHGPFSAPKCSTGHGVWSWLVNQPSPP